MPDVCAQCGKQLKGVIKARYGKLFDKWQCVYDDAKAVTKEEKDTARQETETIKAKEIGI